MLRDAVNRLVRWLRGSDVVPAPDEMVEILIVPFHEGPMTVDLLRREGIRAESHEIFDVVTKAFSRVVVRVPFASVEDAEAVLARR